MSSIYFHYFVIISPWKRTGPFIWTNFNPLHPRMFCAKFGWNWLCGSGEEDFLIWSMYFFPFSWLSPLGKGRGPSFEQTWIPFIQGCSVPSLVENGPVVLKKKMKMWKVYRRMDRRMDWRTDKQTDRQTTDDRWSEKPTWAFSSGELKSAKWNIFHHHVDEILFCAPDIILK